MEEALPELRWVPRASEDAWLDLLQGEVAAVVVDAPPGEAALRRARDLGLELPFQVVRRVSLHPVVHASNPVRRLDPPTLRALFSGALVRWEPLGGNGAVVPVHQRPEAWVSRCLRAVLDLDEVRVAGRPRPDGRAVARAVASLPGAIAALLDHDPGLAAPGIGRVTVVPAGEPDGRGPTLERWRRGCTVGIGVQGPPDEETEALRRRLGRALVTALDPVGQGGGAGSGDDLDLVP